MVKSLGDYNKEKSSLVNVKNIKWSQKNPADSTIQKKKKKKKISPLNIIPKKKTTETKIKQKVYKIEENSNEEKSKKEKLDKKSQKSSVTNCKIKPGFRRPGR